MIYGIPIRPAADCQFCELFDQSPERNSARQLSVTPARRRVTNSGEHSLSPISTQNDFRQKDETTAFARSYLFAPRFFCLSLFCLLRGKFLTGRLGNLPHGSGPHSPGGTCFRCLSRFGILFQIWSFRTQNSALCLGRCAVFFPVSRIWKRFGKWFLPKLVDMPENR